LISSPAQGGADLPEFSGEVCLLINPLSCRTLYGSLAARAAELARAEGVPVVMNGDPAAILTVLQRLRERRLSQLWVLSGDGTIQLIARFLLELPAGDWQPSLLLLGGGRANVVPRAFGGAPALPALRAALKARREQRPLTMESQPLLKIEQEGQPTQHGFVVAGSMVNYGIRICRDFRARGNGWWHRGLFADPWCLIKIALKVAIGCSPLPPYPQLDIVTDTGERMIASVRVLMASALLHASGHYNPYADRGKGPLRVMAVAVDARSFWRHLPRMLSGRYDENMTTVQGFLSGRCSAVTIMGLNGYSLDGEPVDVDPRLPLRFSTGMSLNILKP
jgi:diacylglycerol kinase family enzyme